jgi:FkbM family methyltransferase
MTRFGIKLRSLARRVGLLALIQPMFRGRTYEEEFGNAMLGEVRPGDVVWDVGANVGLYTRKFIDKVGPSGKVVAFEPAPTCFEILRRECASGTLVNAALSDRAGAGFMEVFDQPQSGTHHLVSEPAPNSVPIKIIAGDEYPGPTPNVVKIDVEGFEDEVLAGMPRILADPRLRAIFLEVHFALLEQRGKAEAPIQIERKLRSLGFQLKWLRDRSHLQALRYRQENHGSAH